MKQLIQSIRDGNLSVTDVPVPAVPAGHVLIANHSSVVSAGTEKMTLDLSRKSLLGKALERPDQVRKVLEKIRSEGIKTTIEQVQNKLDVPMTMGYSSAGIVIAVGEGVQNFKPGDKVASNGPHAEIVCVPKNLCASVPDNITFDEAGFAVLGSIALQGIRLSKSTLGETVLVIGLGVIGLLTVALLRASGIRVIATDPDTSKCDLALTMGAEVAQTSLSPSGVNALTRDIGADAVIITASTKSNGPIDLAANAVRQKGRVVLVGVVGLELDRRPFYFKEAEFVVSCSYGPGRYDPNYEEKGDDYPLPHVRWTEQRNIQAVLDIMATGSLKINQLISHRYTIDEAEKAYQMIDAGKEPYLGIVLTFPQGDNFSLQQTIPVATAQRENSEAHDTQSINFGLIGAGDFAQVILLPAILKSGHFKPISVCTAKGVSGTHVATRSGFERSTTDDNDILDDPAISAVFIATRHDQHANQITRALEHGKDVFVEKPLCLNVSELSEIETTLTSSTKSPRLMVGYNRRFAPMCKLLKAAFDGKPPATVTIRFNAGHLPADHWTQDSSVGGGRIIGEACHAIDLATYLIGSVPIKVYAESVKSEHQDITDDQCIITTRHANGGIASIVYVSSGSKSFPKERIEIFSGGSVGVIDDYKVLSINDGKRTRHTKMKMDKGHKNEISEWQNTLLSNAESPISWPELRSVSLASILAVQSLREGLPYDIGSSAVQSVEQE